MPLRTLLLAALAAVSFALLTSACEDNAPESGLPDAAAALPPATCTGGSCQCDLANLCTCPAGTDCTSACGATPCTLSCDGASKCNASGTGPVAVQCGGTAECKGNGGDGSSMTCASSPKCELKGGANSSATCAGTSTCKFDLGAGSTVTCQDTSNCDVKCPDCQVTCASTAICALSCPAADGGAVTATQCPDGRLVCGRSCSP